MCDRPTPLSILALSLLFLVLTRPVSAQQVLVQNGATLHMSNGGVWHLRGTRMDFGGVGATAHLKERSRGRVSGGLLTATRALNSPSSVDVAGLGAEISASVDLGKVTVTRGHVRHTLSDSSASIKRFYDLLPSKNNRGLSATLTYHYADAELDTLSEPALELFKSDDGGSTWRPRGADSRDTVANTVTLRRIRFFSRWTLGTSKRAAAGPPIDPPGGGPPGGGPPGGVRPGPAAGRLKLASLKAGVTGDGAVHLTWRPASRQSGDFRVERRPGAAERESEGSWTTISHGTRAPARSGPKGYRFVDEALPYAADTLFYRIGQVGTEGTVRYSEPVAVARKGPKTLQLKETFPNPARSRVTVRYAVPEGEASPGVTLRLYDVLGREVQAVVTAAEAGWHETQLSVTDLASGVYFLRLNAGGRSQTQRLTVVR